MTNEQIYEADAPKYGHRMIAKAQHVQKMLGVLNEEDYISAVNFIEYLQEKRKRERIAYNLNTLAEIQEIFKDDKGWASEQEMLEDMANFRRERQGL